MSDNYNIGAKVKWKWGNGWGRGKVDDRFTEKVTRKIDGNEVTRNADNDDPAYLIKPAPPVIPANSYRLHPSCHHPSCYHPSCHQEYPPRHDYATDP